MSALEESAQLGSELVLYAFDEHVAVLTLSSPETRNALSSELLWGIAQGCRRAVSEGARALVITGSGRTFCAGGDLGGVNEALGGDIDVEIGAMVDELHEVISIIRRLPMPVVVAVNGAAVGAGIALSLAADVRILARSAAFITGYVAVGASPDGGASFHLARALGGPQALSSFLLNRRITSAELADSGLASDVVDDADVLVAAVAVARGLAALSFPAIQAVRDLVYAASSQSLDSHLEDEKQHFLAIAHTPEFRAAVAPFARRDRVVAPA